MTKREMENVLAALRHAMEQEEKSGATMEKYLHDAAGFLRFAGERELTKELVHAYKAELLAKGYSPRSVNAKLAGVNRLLRQLGREDCRVKNEKVQRQIFCPEEKELTREEYIRLVKTAERNVNERLSLILQTICGTGIRISELRFITVEAVRRGEATVSCKNKTRAVFIVKELRKKLLAYSGKLGIKTGSVFVTRSGAPVSRTNVWREMKGLCESAGVSPTKVFPHNLRHLFARVFYGIEKDIAKLADILGHSSIETTRIYIMTSGAEHRRKMELMRLII